VQVDFCRQHGLEVFWSLRMNDRHDSYPLGSRRWTYGLAPFKRDHPEYVFGVPADWERYRADRVKQLWSGVDYGRPEVREHIFRLIEEVCAGYDIDGVELDFLRHPPFFRPGLENRPAGPEHSAAMTGLVRRIRRMADDVGGRRGRPILIVPRLGHSIERSEFHGLDVRRWLGEDLIDFIVAAADDNAAATPEASAGALIELGHRHGAPVYAGLAWGFWSYWAFLDSGYDTPERWRKASGSHWQATDSWPGTMAAWRGAASAAWGAGADGIYTFNVWDPGHPLFRELGDPVGLAALDTIHGVTFFNDRERALPITERGVAVPVRVGRDVRARSVSALRLRAHVLGSVRPEDVTSRLNGKMLARSAAGGTLPGGAGQWLEYSLDPRQVQVGENRFQASLTHGRPAPPDRVLLDALLLEVRHAT